MTKTECIVSGRYSHPVLGDIHVKAHAQSRSIKARWNGQEVLITVPVCCPFSEFRNFIDNAEIQKKLLALRPAPAFFVGMIIDTPLVDFSIVYSDDVPKGHDGAFEINTNAPARPLFSASSTTIYSCSPHTPHRNSLSPRERSSQQISTHS